jgi:hypothetical protein
MVMNPHTIPPGTYPTSAGNVARVGEWGQNILGELCYRGTVEGQGVATWSFIGLDLSSDDHLVFQVTPAFQKAVVAFIAEIVQLGNLHILAR